MTEIKNLEAEQATLGALLIDPSGMPIVRRYLRPNYFADKLNGKIYQAMWSQYNKNRDFDLLTLTQCFPSSKDVLIHATDSVPTSVNVEYYARMVSGCAMRRNIRRYAEKMVAEAEDVEMPVKEILGRAKMVIDRFIETVK